MPPRAAALWRALVRAEPAHCAAGRAGRGAWACLEVANRSKMRPALATAVPYDSPAAAARQRAPVRAEPAHKRACNLPRGLFAGVLAVCGRGQAGNLGAVRRGRRCVAALVLDLPGDRMRPPRRRPDFFHVPARRKHHAVGWRRAVRLSKVGGEILAPYVLGKPAAKDPARLSGMAPAACSTYPRRSPASDRQTSCCRSPHPCHCALAAGAPARCGIFGPAIRRARIANSSASALQKTRLVPPTLYAICVCGPSSGSPRGETA